MPALAYGVLALIELSMILMGVVGLAAATVLTACWGPALRAWLVRARARVF